MDDIIVHGNVEGSIVKGNNNFVVNTNNGTIIRQEALSTQRRALSPKPPDEPEGFVGRTNELKQLEAWIADCKAVIISGVDGIGKTSLIKEAANTQSAKSLPDGVIYVDALDEEGNLLQFGDLVQRIFDALFESQPHEKVDLTSARTYLSNTQPLVLLNAIGLSPKNLEQLQNLFSKAPILVTTENSALTIGRKYSISLGPLDRDASLNLLSHLTSSEDQETLTQIATLLENVPAALNMVAYPITGYGLSATEVLERLQSYTPKEKVKAKAALERAFYLLSSLIPEDQRDALDQVAANFGVSVNRAWLENVCGSGAVAELEKHGLLFANSPRLRLMPGLKPLLQESEDLTKQRERLRDYLLDELKTRWNDFEFIKDELGNLLGLLAWLVATGQWANVAALGRAIDPFLTLRGHWDAWHDTLKQVQSAAQATSNLALQGWVLHQLGTYEFGMGNLSAAQTLLDQAVSIRKQLGDQTGVAYSQHNLHVIAPAAPAPTSRPVNMTVLALGGVAVVALVGGIFFFSNTRKNQPPPTAVPVVAPSVVTVAALPSATLTLTSTLTPTLTPSPTITATLTPTSTDTPTATPTYTTLTNVVVNDLAACFYGPGTMYLNKGTARIAGNTVDLLGRIETNTGIWVNTKFSLPRTDASDPCWMNVKHLNITPEQLTSIQPIDPNNPQQYQLPGDRISRGRYLQNPVVTGVNRTGTTVNIQWQNFDVGVGEYPEHDPTHPRYLIEAWICKAGKIVFTPSGWGPFAAGVTTGSIVSANIIDEPGCPEPSHARLYLVWAHGYVGPTEVTPWPQNGSTSASTPTP